jgi:hypothetical protein
VTRLPIRYRCDHCNHIGRYYVVRDRLLHLCYECWRADTHQVLDDYPPPRLMGT